MRGYGQFCPVAKTAEILGERWMLLLVRELLMGSTRFGQLKQGLGSISPSMLTNRLRTLEEYDIIYREKSADGHSYHLTERGAALKPVIEAAGLWGYRWIRDSFEEEDLDVDLLMLDISRRLQTDKIRGRKATIEFEYSDLDSRYRNWWLIVDGEDVELCYDHPGRSVDLTIRCKLETMTRIWMGELEIASARRSNLLQVEGARRLAKNLSSWLTRSHIAQLAHND